MNSDIWALFLGFDTDGDIVTDCEKNSNKGIGEG